MRGQTPRMFSPTPTSIVMTMLSTKSPQPTVSLPPGRRGRLRSRGRRMLGLLAVLTGLIGSDLSAQLPAFPGAEGFGSLTPGGRGGRLFKVTSLADSGPGTFREALDTPPAFAGEPRIIIFEKGGVIDGEYDSIMRVKYPYTTIAGQTAPGDGICLKGATLQVQTHDVIIRGFRARLGDDGTPGQAPDSFSITNWNNAAFTTTTDVYNIIVDHCSFSWGVDGNIDVFEQVPFNGTHVRDITISWCINSEALARSIHHEASPEGHSTGGTTGRMAERLSFHHNLFASNHHRNLLIRTGEQVEFINNLVYNWGTEGTNVVPKGTNPPPTFMNALGNYYKAGPNTEDSQNVPGEKRRGLAFKFDMPTDSRIYVEGNIGPGRLTNTGDEWAATSRKAVDANTPIEAIHRATSLIAAADSGTVTVNTPQDGYDLVLAHVGAIAPNRDSTDARVVGDVANGTGAIYDYVENNRQSDPWFAGTPPFIGVSGGYPTYATGTAPTDSDNDGIPDSWETANSLNPNNASDANSTAPSGYTWIEVYINSLIPAPQSNPPPPGPAFTDDFEDGNADGWSPASGSWSVVTDGSDVYQQVNSTQNAHSYASATSWTDYTVEARVKVTSFAATGNGRAGVLGRVTDGTNHYYLGLFKDNTIELQSKVAGSTTTLASGSYTVTPGVWYTVKLEMIGSTLKAYVNNVLQLTVTDTAFSSGHIGLGGWNAAARFDDIVVTPDVPIVAVFNDDFEDGDANGWSPTAGSWSVLTDGTKVYDQANLTQNAHSFVTATSWSNYTVSARVKVTNFAGTGNGRAGVLGRVTDIQNHYFVGLFKDNTLEIQSKVGGSTTTLGSVAYTVTPGVWYTVELEMTGSTLKAYVNNVLQLTVTDTTFASGHIGVGGWNAAARYDDVTATQP